MLCCSLDRRGRANTLIYLGFPEPAAADAYKSIMLCDAGIYCVNSPRVIRVGQATFTKCLVALGKYTKRGEELGLDQDSTDEDGMAVERLRCLQCLVSVHPLITF